MIRYLILTLILQESLSAGGQILRWVKQIPRNGHQIESLHCLNEEKSLLVGYDNAQTAEWDYTKIKLKRQIPGVIKRISHNMKHAVFIQSDNAVIRTLPTFDEKWRVPGANFSEVIFSPQDQFLALQQLGTLTIWFTDKQKQFVEMRPDGKSPASIDFSSNEQFLAISQYEKYGISLFDLKNKKQLASLNSEMDANTPRPLLGPHVSFHTSRPILAYSDTFNAYVANIFKPQIVCRLSEHTNFITHLEFLPKTDLLLTSGGRLDPRIIVWDFQTCMKEQVFDLHQDAVAAIRQFGETGMISGDESGKIYAWSRTDPAKMIELAGSKGSVTDLAVCPGQRLVASSDYDGNVNIWQLPSPFGQ